MKCYFHENISSNEPFLTSMLQQDCKTLTGISIVRMRCMCSYKMMMSMLFYAGYVDKYTVYVCFYWLNSFVQENCSLLTRLSSIKMSFEVICFLAP